jgi:hypothetical protein
MEELIKSFERLIAINDKLLYLKDKEIVKYKAENIILKTGIVVITLFLICLVFLNVKFKPTGL